MSEGTAVKTAAIYTRHGVLLGGPQLTEKQQLALTCSGEPRIVHSQGMPTALDLMVTDEVMRGAFTRYGSGKSEWAYVLDEMENRGWQVRIQTAPAPGQPCRAGFLRHGASGEPEHEVWDTRVSLAVCRAALLTCLAMKAEGTTNG